MKQIIGDDKIRVQMCMNDVIKVLESYDCALIPEIIISGNGQITGRLQIVAKPRVVSSN